MPDFSPAHIYILAYTHTPTAQAATLGSFAHSTPGLG